MSSNMSLLLVLPAMLVFAKSMYIEDFSNVQMHPACKDKFYCLEQTHDYPYERIEKLLMHKNIAYIDSSTPEHRQSDVNSPCKAKNTNSPIYQIRDINGKVRFVVQTKRFQQIIRLEWCENKGIISNNTEDLPFDVNQLKNDSTVATCEESYTNYKFLVLSLDGQSLESAMVGETSIPVCCRCKMYDVPESVI